MTTLEIQAITKEYGCIVYTTIKVSEDYTMNEVVTAVRNAGYKAFRLVNTMKRFVTVQQRLAALMQPIASLQHVTSRDKCRVKQRTESAQHKAKE